MIEDFQQKGHESELWPEMVPGSVPGSVVVLVRVAEWGALNGSLNRNYLET